MIDVPCQRWDERRQSWRHTSEGGFDPARYAVEPVDELPAKEYVVTNHYAGSYPAASHRYGIYEAGELLGVCVLGIPVQTKTLTNPFPTLEPFVESLELSRLVLHDDVPANAESWFIARVFEHAAARGVRGIVSFSDPVPRRVDDRLVMPGHVGTIYQASNALYAGRGTARSLVLLPNGQVLNNRAMQKVRGQERGHEHVEKMLVGLGARAMRAGERPTPWLHEAIDTVGSTRLRHRGNHRYLFTIGTRSQRRAVTVHATTGPYPKDIDHQ